MSITRIFSTTDGNLTTEYETPGAKMAYLQYAAGTGHNEAIVELPAGLGGRPTIILNHVETRTSLEGLKNLYVTLGALLSELGL